MATRGPILRRSHSLSFTLIRRLTEPIPHARGLQVRLVYANRNERQIVYRRRLHELLALYPSTFRVRHCLSRPLASLDAGADRGSGGRGALREKAGGVAGRLEEELLAPLQCVVGEQTTQGRVDEAVLRQEFGDWALPSSTALADATGTFFVVTGTGAMERTAWSTLASLGVGRANHLLRGGGWRPLVP